MNEKELAKIHFLCLAVLIEYTETQLQNRKPCIRDVHTSILGHATE